MVAWGQGQGRVYLKASVAIFSKEIGERPVSPGCAMAGSQDGSMGSEEALRSREG